MLRSKSKIIFGFDNGQEQTIYVTKEQFKEYVSFFRTSKELKITVSNFGPISVFLDKVSYVKFKE